MRPDLATALSAIDQVIGGCQQCAEPLDTGGPSVDFCSCLLYTSDAADE